MTPPTHLEAAGKAMWSEITGRPAFDPRDTYLVETLCEVADMKAKARVAVLADMSCPKAHASYARLVDKQLTLLDALGMTPKSRFKLGEEPKDDAADEMRAFAARANA
jgi:phage terminase small subunit